ncbi:alpha/beta fold hydrolase [Actinocatenispora rupis]|uniref:Hydrolase n=1 Tax=Actinocatenispora rupis TaxID=519421 RepID=A0A8J3JF24_9ACTN|nr:alpha/beta hydrolase [Actinocatenispora rupis]GID15267.1 hydrolase [Actinocatenispora rupis]
MPTYLGADGATLHYDVLPHDDRIGPIAPVIALAGGAALHPAYLGDLAGLTRDHRVLVPHLRGVGRSPLPADVTVASYWRQAEDLERLRIHLGLDTLRLLGHSAGTRLAISYAVRFPDRVAGLVLVTPPAAYLVDEPSDTRPMIDRRRGEPAADAAIAALDAGPATPDDAGLNAWQLRIAPLGYATWGDRERAHAAESRYDYAANRAYFSVDPPADLAARLTTVTAPVLVLAGADDCFAGVAPVTALAALFPHATCTVLPHTAHFPWLDNPHAFRQATTTFLTTLR